MKTRKMSPSRATNERASGLSDPNAILAPRARSGIRQHDDIPAVFDDTLVMEAFGDDGDGRDLGFVREPRRFVPIEDVAAEEPEDDPVEFERALQGELDDLCFGGAAVENARRAVRAEFVRAYGAERLADVRKRSFPSERGDPTRGRVVRVNFVCERGVRRVLVTDYGRVHENPRFARLHEEVARIGRNPNRRRRRRGGRGRHGGQRQAA